MRQVVLATLMSALALPLAAAPAHAANEVVVNMPGGVLYDTCDYQEYSYSAAMPAGFSNWSMDVKLTGPDGNEVDTDFLYDDSLSGFGDFFVCESPNLAGTYTVTGTGEACNVDYDCVPISAVASTATFRLPMTRTTLKMKPRRPVKNQVVRFTVTSKDERPAGYFGTTYADVSLQVSRGGRWKTLESTSTDDTGRTVIKARYSGRPVKVRAVTKSTSSLTGSESRVLRVR